MNIFFDKYKMKQNIMVNDTLQTHKFLLIGVYL